MSILAYNGGAVVAMKGDNCLAIASDKRFGIQAQTVSVDVEKVFQMGPHLYVGLPGLTTDMQTVHNKLRFRKNLYELRENRRMSTKAFTSMLSNLLYEKRFGPFFVEPIVAGLEEKEDGKWEPYIAAMDLIGCVTLPDDFVVGGTCTNQLYGMCEVLYEPNLKPNELYETVAQALVNACDRDAVSGWGAVVYVVEKDKVTVRHVKTRMD